MNALSAYIAAQPAETAETSGLVGAFIVDSTGREATANMFTFEDMMNVRRFPLGTPVSGDALAIIRATS